MTQKDWFITGASRGLGALWRPHSLGADQSRHFGRPVRLAEGESI
jgi:hypothetical protein